MTKQGSLLQEKDKIFGNICYEHDNPVGELISDFYSKCLNDVAKATKEGKRFSSLSSPERSVSRTGPELWISNVITHPIAVGWSILQELARWTLSEEIMIVTLSATEVTTDVSRIEVEWVSIEESKCKFEHGSQLRDSTKGQHRGPLKTLESLEGPSEDDVFYSTKMRIELAHQKAL